MADTLTQLTSKLQALLLDDGTLFTSGTCTAAIRQALARVNQRLPIHGGTLVDIVSGQYEYELTTALAGATPLRITDVKRQDPAGNQYDVALDFDQYIEDERWFLRLHTPETSGHLIVTFTQAHTISGLDSATESTLPASYDPVLTDGAAYYACMIAGAGKVEENNLDQDTAGNYAKAARQFLQAFNYGLAALTALRPIQKGIPDDRTWEDKWHSAPWQ